MPRLVRLLRIFSFLLLCLLFACIRTGAQDAATGAIQGTVLDPSGGRVPQALIVLINTGMGMRYSTTSDAEGRFAFQSLPPGDYSARATAQGMSPQVTPPLHVDVGGAVEFEFRMALAGAKENITVSGDPALVETRPSSVSTLVDERAIADLPLNGRRFSDLALFSPGVTQDPRSLTSATNGDLSFGGIRGFQNSTLVDGGDYNNGFFAQARGRYRAPYQFSTEVVQEFRISSNSYGADMGRAGGAVINIVTKSGSNHVHGTAFYYFRDSAFGATNPFMAFKPHNRQQQLGGTVGGPLKRNKIFFFAGFDQHISCAQRRRISRWQFASCATSRGGAGHAWRLRAFRSGPGLRLRGALDHTGWHLSGGAAGKFRVRQARHQSFSARATGIARQYFALLGSQQCVSRSVEPGYIRLDQQQR